jgi:hypothetical protein
LSPGAASGTIRRAAGKGSRRKKAMAVAIEMRFTEATLEQYDDVMRRMGLGGEAPEGALFHWVAQTDGGIVVVDVWETMEQFDRFAREQIGPHTQAAGIAGPPEITTYAVHNYLSA